MSRKRSKKKSGRKQGGNPPADQRARLLRELTECLAAGRGRRALGLAKELLKSGTATPEDSRVFGAVYSLRAFEMIADGHAREAGEMVDAVTAAHPDWVAHLDSAAVAVLDCHRPRPTILHRYGQGDAETDGVIAAALQAHLIDPRELAGCPGLSADHPLRVEAAAVMAAWEAVEAGQPDALNGLRDVSRRSPLVHWRLFVQALHAYHAHDDETMAANLDRIPTASAVRALADALAGLARGEAPAVPSGPAFLEQTRGPSLAGRLDALDRARARHDRRLETLGREVVNELRAAGRPALAADVEATVIIARHGAETYLDRVVESSRTIDDARLRLLLPRLATAAYPHDAELWHDLGATLAGLSPLAEALLWRHVAEVELEIFTTGDGGPLQRGARDRADESFRRSVAAVPLRETLRLWTGFRNRFAQDMSEALAAWERHFPDDAEMVRARLQHHRLTNNVDAALADHDLLVDHTGSSAETMALRGAVLLDAALAAYRAGDRQGALAAAAQVEGRTPLLAVGRAVVEWLCAEGRGERRARGETLAALGQPLLALHVGLCFDPDLKYAGLPAGVKRGFDNAELLDSVIACCRIEDERWQLIDVPELRRVAASFRRTPAAPEKLLETIGQLVAYTHGCRGAKMDILHLIMSLTANGLGRAASCPRTPFLAWRGWVYGELDADGGERAFDVLAAAAWFAKAEKTDAAIVDTICRETSIVSVHEEAARLSKRQAQAILKREAAVAEIPWSMLAMARWRNPAAYDDPYGDDVDDLDYLDDEDEPDELDEMAACADVARALLDMLPRGERRRQEEELRRSLPPDLRNLPGDPLEIFEAAIQTVREDPTFAPSSPPKPKPKPKPPPPTRRKPPEDDDRQLELPF